MFDEKKGTFCRTVKMGRNSKLSFAIKCTIYLAQCFSLMPVCEYDGEWVFNWFSLKTTYSLVMIFLQTVYTFAIYLYALQDGGNFFNYVVFIWNIRALAEMICFVKIAKKWPKLMASWAEFDQHMEHFSYQFNLSRRIKLMGLTAATATLFEHSMFVTTGIKMVLSKPNGTIHPVENYFKTLYREIFMVTEYTLAKAAIVEVLSLISTFLRMFGDFFVVILSCALALRLHQLVKRTKHAKVLHDDFFRRMQAAYASLGILTQNVNSILSELIMISFSSNLYFLSVSLIEILTPRIGTLSNLYYYYNLFYQIAHLAAMCIYCSWLREENNKLMTTIFDLPSSKYSEEVDRFAEQVHYQRLAINAGRMFSFTRNSFLKSIYVIVTIQLLLIEFRSEIVGNIE